ncbi:autotransporter assembly complex family protein [Roseateles sp. BYS180W]|uniref:Autotransporter assembly complex family protein n=1 Tax=Roseateles rivi TaxID=3299028 RepID=A0ABW7FRX0_9BURK
MLLTACAGLLPPPPAALPPASADAASSPAPLTPAVPVRFKLQIEAPSAQRELLQEHLDLARFERSPPSGGLSSTELARLALSTPDQARALLQTQGFFNPELTLLRPPPEANGLRLLQLSVQPGAQVLVDGVDLKLQGAVQTQAQAEALRQSWALGKGAGFSQSAWSAAKSALLTQLKRNGYPLARWVSTSARVYEQEQRVDLELTLDSGPQVLLGALDIQGLSQQPQSVVRRLAGFSPGEPYSEKALLDFQDRLIATQLFDSAAVELSTEQVQPMADQASLELPVQVQLREAPRQELTASLGYLSADGPRLGLEHKHRRALGLNLRSHTKLVLGREKSQLDIELSSHPQPDMQRTLGTLNFERQRLASQQLYAAWARLGYVRETEAQDRLRYLELLRAWEHSPGQPTLSAGAITLNQQLVWRQLDAKLLPTQGYSLALLTGAGWTTNSSQPAGPMARLKWQGQAYARLGSQWLLSSRAEAAQVLARSSLELPEVLRFRTGGDDSVRGYGSQELGPTDELGRPTGGRVMLAGSVEFSHPLRERWPGVMGAVFVDAGQAAQRWQSLRPDWSWGLGLRYRSPVGVLRVDAARAQATGSWRFHFGVVVGL